jgi:hypothetical protein
MRLMLSALLFGSVALLGSGAAAAAPPADKSADKSAADVTITVVNDPGQLNEKVNLITLPAANDGKSKTAEHADQGKQADKTDGNAKHDAEDNRHDVGDKRQSDTDGTRQDIHDVQQQNTDKPDGADDK